jgi:hypothetical protein
MLMQPVKLAEVAASASRPRPPHAVRRIESMVTGVAHEIELVDVVEFLVLPMIVYAAHRLDEMTKNYVEPERTLLRPRITRG